METSHITAYIDYLKQECDLSVSLHILKQTSRSVVEKLLPYYNLHENPYCIYLKLLPEMWRACVARQGKVLHACRDGAICGTCHAGVREFVYPITTRGETVGFISVSGYADPEKAEECRRRLTETFGFREKELAEMYGRLSPVLPPRRRVDTLLYPLCAMLTLALDGAEDAGAEANFASQLRHYLHLNHNRRLTMEEICEEFHCSLSYVSHRFKEQTGMTVHKYLTRLRVENAARLLRASKLQITEIAIATGFENGNYFSHVFRTEMGMSPLAYRCAEQEKEKEKKSETL